MQVILEKAAKQFGREIIFRNVDLVLAPGSRTAILGPNGSGKSTLLQLIAGAIAPTKGSIQHRIGDRTIPIDEVYRSVSIASPYLGLYEDLSLRQAIAMHARFKPLLPGITNAEVARIAYLEHAIEKPVSQFSSGMKQRLKLSLAILSDTPLLLLDEPSSNLDQEAIGWYREILPHFIGQRTLLVASNRQRHEYEICTASIEMEELKD